MTHFEHDLRDFACWFTLMSQALASDEPSKDWWSWMNKLFYNVFHQGVFFYTTLTCSHFLVVPNYSFLSSLCCRDKEVPWENSSTLCTKKRWHDFWPPDSLIQIWGWALPHLYGRCCKLRLESSEISPVTILQSPQGRPTHLWMFLYWTILVIDLVKLYSNLDKTTGGSVTSFPSAHV